jgi:hypothetical protein
MQISTIAKDNKFSFAIGLPSALQNRKYRPFFLSL